MLFKKNNASFSATTVIEQATAIHILKKGTQVVNTSNALAMFAYHERIPIFLTMLNDTINSQHSKIMRNFLGKWAFNMLSIELKAHPNKSVKANRR